MGRDPVGHSLANEVGSKAPLALVDNLEPHWSEVAKTAGENSPSTGEFSPPRRIFASLANFHRPGEFSPTR